MGQTEGVMPHPWALPGRSFGWGGACVCSEASVSPTIPAGADPACQSPARAISGMWNLGQRRGGTEGVPAAGKLASPQLAGGGRWAAPCPAQGHSRGVRPSQALTISVSGLPIHPPAGIWPESICAHVRVTKSFHASQRLGAQNSPRWGTGPGLLTSWRHMLRTGGSLLSRGDPCRETVSEGGCTCGWWGVSVRREVVTGQNAMDGGASFTLMKGATYKGGAVHNTDIIELYIYYDTSAADGSKGPYSNKNCAS